MLFPAFGNHFSSLDSFLIKIGAGNYLVKQARTPPVRSADGGVGWFYESFVPVKWHCWLEKEILRFLLLQGGAGENDIRLDCPFEG